MEIKLGIVYLTNNKVIKVSELDEEFAFGYDLENEKLIKVKISTLIPLTPAIQKLISSERLRYFIALSDSTKIKDIADKMGVSERTIHRLELKFL